MENKNNKKILKKTLTWLSFLWLPGILSSLIFIFGILPNINHFNNYNFIIYEGLFLIFLTIFNLILLYKSAKYFKKINFKIHSAKKYLLAIFFTNFVYFMSFMIIISKLVNKYIKSLPLKEMDLPNLSYFTIIQIISYCLLAFLIIHFILNVLATLLSYYFSNESIQNNRTILRKTMFIYLLFYIFAIFVLSQIILITISFFINCAIIIFDTNRIKFSKAEGEDVDRLALISALSLYFGSINYLFYYLFNNDIINKRFNQENIVKNIDNKKT